MKKIIIIIILLITCVFLYGHYIEINKLKTNKFKIYAPNISDSFKELKIVHFSDILYDKDEAKLDNIISTINKENADIVVFSGDLFNDRYSYNDDDINYLKDELKKIKATLYKFAVIGDNDLKFLNSYKDLLYEAEFKLLDNENMLLFYKDNTPINIIGISDVNKIDDLLKTDVEVSHTIVITHEPDNANNLIKNGVNTILSGHSLGGIIKLPYLNGIIKKEGAKTYINSYYKENDTEIFISNGLGYEKFNYRLFNTPSINIYQFKK